MTRYCKFCGGGGGASKPLFRDESPEERILRKNRQRDIDSEFFKRQEASMMSKLKNQRTFPKELPLEFVNHYRTSPKLKRKSSPKKKSSSPKRSPQRISYGL